MVLLKSPLKEEVEELIERSNQEYIQKEYDKSIRLLEEAWSKLPQPKVLYDDSYHIVNYLIETYLFLNKAELASEWTNLMLISDLERFDDGDREFVVGKVYYELNKLEIAKEFFYIANKKSDGRCFEGEEQKYRSLII